MLAVIRIARGSAATDAFSRRSVWISDVWCFLSRGRSDGLDFINQTIDFVGFPFKVYGSTGVSVGAVSAPNRWLHKHWTRARTHTQTQTHSHTHTLTLTHTHTHTHP